MDWKPWTIKLHRHRESHATITSEMFQPVSRPCRQDPVPGPPPERLVVDMVRYRRDGRCASLSREAGPKLQPGRLFRAGAILTYLGELLGVSRPWEPPGPLRPPSGSRLSASSIRGRGWCRPHPGGSPSRRPRSCSPPMRRATIPAASFNMLMRPATAETAVRPGATGLLPRGATLYPNLDYGATAANTTTS